MMNEIKLCKDCEHYEDSTIQSWCASPDNGIRLTDGLTQKYWAVVVRYDESKCGRGGLWFTPKTIQPPSPEPMLESIQPWKPFSWIKKLW